MRAYQNSLNAFRSIGKLAKAYLLIDGAVRISMFDYTGFRSLAWKASTMQLWLHIVICRQVALEIRWTKQEGL